MRFKIDENLKRVAAAKAARPETVAVELCARFIDSGMIEDTPDNWGESVLTATGPHCGGELEFVETEGHELKDGDYYTPNSYIVDNYVYRCVECGEIIKTPNEL